MLPRKKLIVCGSAVVGGVWWVALLSCETLCVWVHPGLARANLAAPTKQSSPVRLKEVCSFDKKDGEAPERFLSVVFASDDGQRVYTTSFAPKQQKVFLRAWDIVKEQVLWQRTAAEIKEFPLYLFRLTTTTESIDGSLLAYNDYGKVQVWNAAGRKVKDIEVPIIPPRLERRDVYVVRFSPDGKYLVALHAGGVASRIMCWHKQRARAARGVFPGDPPLQNVGRMDFPPDRYEGIYALDPDAGRGPSSLLSFAFVDVYTHPLHRLPYWEIAVAGIYSRIAVWDLLRATIVRSWDLDQSSWRVYDLEMVQAGNEQYLVSAHPLPVRFFLLDENSRTQDTVMKLEAERTAQSSGHAIVWTKKGVEVARCKHEGAVVSLATVPKQPRFVSAEYCVSWNIMPDKHIQFVDLPSRIYIWDIAGRKLAVGEGHTMGVTDVAVSPDGKRIASCGVDGTLRIWEMPALR